MGGAGLPSGPAEPNDDSQNTVNDVITDAPGVADVPQAPPVTLDAATVATAKKLWESKDGAVPPDASTSTPTPQI
jgi:hypothetical protein